ncbi:hypothetical protein SLEP1_g53807 [Rubroshorea leprosula]|uniref:Uncharacterized protein n=1 Tax=Rubroshorea leprosula TaxID=152421 RepID=A0AAV5MAK6_9ROSI|nr:hypothetical protein SLEP1_g53807 [Rubroshorea leprosula]
MADAVITLLVIPVIEEALSRVASTLGRRIGQFLNSGDLKAELEKLQWKLKFIEPGLKNVDQMQSDERIRDWLQRLQDAVDDLRILLDEDAYGVHRQKGRIPSQFKKQVHNFLSPSKSMASKIKEINGSFDEILKYLDCSRLINHNQNREAPRREADEINVLQRDGDVSEIESLLDELSQKHRLSGLSIVGMPGVGKTTVARSICVRAMEMHPSSLVALVPVDKDFNEEMILGQMLKSLDSHAGGMTDIDPILHHLKPMLKNKKVLLILDGVWNEKDAQGLKEIISCLPQRFETARIFVVITTSNKEVASLMMDTIPWRKYELQKLSDEDCWLIMEENVLRSSNGTPIEDPQLLLIGKDIAKQCGEAEGMVVFPCLEELHIEHCPELKTWWQDGSAYPKLSMLGIQSCPNLQAIPIGLSNLTSLDINNCPKLMEYAQEGSHKWSSIRHAHRIRINGQIVLSRRS